MTPEYFGDERSELQAVLRFRNCPQALTSATEAVEGWEADSTASRHAALMAARAASEHAQVNSLSVVCVVCQSIIYWRQ